MKLTNRSEYALLALLYLARQGTGIYVHGEEISKVQNIPKLFLQQILVTLRQAKLIKSTRGKDGGYALIRDPKSISLAEIIRHFEGALASTKSASRYFYESTPIEQEKKILSLFKEIRNLVAGKMEKTTLADMM